MKIIPDGRGVKGRETKPTDIADYEKSVMRIIQDLSSPSFSLVASVVVEHLQKIKGKHGVLRILPARATGLEKTDEPHYTKDRYYHEIIFFDPLGHEKFEDPFNLATAHTTLLHEMIHAAFQDKGKDQRTGSTFWTDKAEFTAITIVNMFRAEKGFKHLRYGHHRFMSLSKEMGPKLGPKFVADDRLYRNEWSRDIRSMFNFEPGLCNRLSRLPVGKIKWNPLRGGKPTFTP